MKIDEIRSIARSQGIQSGGLSKTELIKSIQTAEGNFDCFATARNGDCDQLACNWRKECLPPAPRN